MNAVPKLVPWPVVAMQVGVVFVLVMCFVAIVLMFKWWSEKPMGYPTTPRPAPTPVEPARRDLFPATTRAYQSLTAIIQEGNRHDRELAAAASRLMVGGGGSATLPFKYSEARFADTIDALLAEADTRGLLLDVGQCDGEQTTITVSKEPSAGLRNYV